MSRFTTRPPLPDETMEVASCADDRERSSDIPLRPGLWIGGRYQVLGLLGRGGMAEVHEVLDSRLQRNVAMKVISEARPASGVDRVRFEAEARLAAGLEHPGIVPVYDFGELDDRRPYFTMPKIVGGTLEEAIRRDRGPAPVAEQSRRRLIDLFRRACEAVAFAHARGVVHRDIKPANIMLGPWGQVHVLDWGIAHLRPSDGGSSAAAPPRKALIAGTPFYMPPEQARGELDRVDARSDVYALGATLFQILARNPPFLGVPALKVIALLARDEVPRLPATLAVPDELRELCGRAMSADPDRRPASAGIFAEALGEWLEGARRRDQARVILEQVRRLEGEAREIEAAVDDLRRRSRLALASLPPAATADDRSAAWALDEEADALRRRGRELHTAGTRRLEEALQLAPDLVEARDRLADRLRAQHEEAEARGDALFAADLEAQLRRHGAARHARYLAGLAALSLRTDPPGAEVRIYRYEERLRRLQLVARPSPGRTPLEAVQLEAGSYLLELYAEGCVPVRYPVSLRREEHWDGVPPEASEALVIRLPRVGELAPDEVYVPAGPFWCGGELEALPSPLPLRRLWADGFVIGRAAITNREWIAFLDALVRAGREEEALARAPRLPSARHGEPGRLLFARAADGRFDLTVDAEGYEWRPERPVVHVDASDAIAYAAWRAERDGLPWRLPAELEWEKAARGVDGRVYPWGRHFDPDWCHSRESRRAGEGPMEGGSYPMDRSPYGVDDMAGNTQCWCADPFPAGTIVRGGRIHPRAATPDGADTRVVVRGGSYAHAAWFCRLDVRKFQLSHYVWGVLGVRIVRSLV